MIYLDYAATTPLRPEAREAMEPFLLEQYGNASSIYGLGRVARQGVDDARHAVARLIGASVDELVFTSGGTESIYTALFGSWLARQPEKKHMITTAVEHHAVLSTCALLEEMGAQVTIVPPDRFGRVRVADVLDQIRPDTGLVSVMSVNNELGSVNPIEDLAKQAHDLYPDVLVHSDMVQAVSACRLNLAESGVDLASFAAHKLGGPKGVGALFIRRGTPWKSILRGGAQERERRAGTENVAGVVGFGAAAEWLCTHFEAHHAVIEKRSAELANGLQQLSGVVWNSPKEAVPHIVNLQFEGIRADRLLMRLDLEGVAASAGSACAAGSLNPSHVLLAVGLTPEEAKQSVRFSLSDVTTEAEVAEAINIIKGVVGQFRGNR